MPPKAAKKAEPKGGKAAPGKKKKWSKGKVRDKLNNMVLFDQATYGKLYKELVLNWSVWEKDDVDEATSLVLRGDKHDQKSLIRKRMRHGRAFTDEHHGRVEQLMETVMARLGAGGHPRYTPKSCRQGYISSYIAELCRRRNETDLLPKNEILDRIQSTGVWDDRRVAEIYMNELVKSYSRDQGAGTCPQTVRGWQECVFRRSFRAKWLRAMQVDKQTLEARMDSQAGRRQQKEDDYWDKTAPIPFDPSSHL